MSDGGRCAKHDNWHAHCQQCCREEVAALRAQVATLTAERDEALEQARQRAARDYLMESLEDPAARDAFCAEWANESVREERDAARAACAVPREALQAEEDYSQKARPSGNAELLERAVMLRRVALATDAGAPVLALLDECAAALTVSRPRAHADETWFAACECEACVRRRGMDDLLTRLKARGPSRFVSVEKVRELTAKALDRVPRITLPDNDPNYGKVVEAEDVSRAMNALLAEVAT